MREREREAAHTESALRILYPNMFCQIWVPLLFLPHSLSLSLPLFTLQWGREAVVAKIFCTSWNKQKLKPGWGAIKLTQHTHATLRGYTNKFVHIVPTPYLHTQYKQWSNEPFLWLCANTRRNLSYGNFSCDSGPSKTERQKERRCLSRS